MSERGQNKGWLIARAREQGISERTIYRWTVNGDPRSGGSLEPKSVIALVAVFGDVPPGADPEIVGREQRDLAAELDELRARVAKLEGESDPGASQRARARRKQ